MPMLDVGSGVSFPDELWYREQDLFPDELISLISGLHREFAPRRRELLEARKSRQKDYDSGMLPDFLPRDSEAVTGNWKVGTIPEVLRTRRVEITGPVNSAKMVINMLSRSADGARADMAMLDFEDSLKPSFENVLEGFHNVIGAVSGTLSFTSPEGKSYKLDPDDMAYVMVRCRGLHLDEVNMTVDGEPVSAGLFDLAVNYFHTANIYLAQKKTPKYYVPKCEHYLEARWWNDLFTRLEEFKGHPAGTLKATFLIETLPATFQVEEILYEIRDHAAGLNVGRWDKIFSDIKVLRNHRDRILADRGSINMLCPWMENYAKRVIRICHARGAFGMGGMSAFTPGKTEQERQTQTRKVFEDKSREFSWGHDGCWVSHPFFISHAMKAFPRINQLDRSLAEFDKYSPVLPESTGPHTLEGLRTNIRVAIAYIHGWNKDIGCISFDNLMEDLATLEISRAQIWQWLHHELTLDGGEVVSTALVSKLFDEELEKLVGEFGESERSALQEARHTAHAFSTSVELAEFLCLQSEPFKFDYSRKDTDHGKPSEARQ